MLLKNKIAVVTGASAGIGRAIAVALAQEGARVFLLARSIDGLKKTLDLITKKNGKAEGKAEVLPMDLRRVSDIQDTARIIAKKAGRVDILVNVAGIYHGKDKGYSDIDFEKYPVEVIQETFDVGITAPTLLCHALLPIMPSSGKIVNISGTFENGAKGWLPYFVSKKAIEDLTVGLAQEARPRGIQVNCISPSDTLTESYKKFFPESAKPETCLEPEEVARLAVFLCSTEADTITGQVIVIKNKDA